MQIDNTQEIDCTLVPDGTIDGVVGWVVESGNSTLGNITPDGLTATLKSEDGVGQTVYKATGSPGPGLPPISIEVPLDVVAHSAHGFQATFGAPRPKTP